MPCRSSKRATPTRRARATSGSPSATSPRCPTASSGLPTVALLAELRRPLRRAARSRALRDAGATSRLLRAGRARLVVGLGRTSPRPACPHERRPRAGARRTSPAPPSATARSSRRCSRPRRCATSRSCWRSAAIATAPPRSSPPSRSWRACPASRRSPRARRRCGDEGVGGGGAGQPPWRGVGADDAGPAPVAAHVAAAGDVRPPAPAGPAGEARAPLVHLLRADRAGEGHRARARVHLLREQLQRPVRRVHRRLLVRRPREHEADLELRGRVPGPEAVDALQRVHPRARLPGRSLLLRVLEGDGHRRSAGRSTSAMRLKRLASAAGPPKPELLATRWNDLWRPPPYAPSPGPSLAGLFGRDTNVVRDGQVYGLTVLQRYPRQGAERRRRRDQGRSGQAEPVRQGRRHALRAPGDPRPLPVHGTAAPAVRAVVDGDVDEYLERLCERSRTSVKAVWQHCNGAPVQLGPIRRRSRAGSARASSRRRPSSGPTAVRRCTRYTRRWSCGATPRSSRAGCNTRPRACCRRSSGASGTSGACPAMMSDLQLEDMQGNILQGYGHRFCAYQNLRISDAEEGRRLLANLLPDVTNACRGGTASRVDAQPRDQPRGADALELPIRCWGASPTSSAGHGRACRAAQGRRRSAPKRWQPVCARATSTSWRSCTRHRHRRDEEIKRLLERFDGGAGIGRARAAGRAAQPEQRSSTSRSPTASG